MIGLIGTPATKDRAAAAFLTLLAAAAILVPVLNLAVPASSPLHLSTYALSLIGICRSPCSRCRST